MVLVRLTHVAQCMMWPLRGAQLLNALLEESPLGDQYAEWRAEIDETRNKFPMMYPKRDDVIMPQWAIQVLPSLPPPRLLSRGRRWTWGFPGGAIVNS